MSMIAFSLMPLGNGSWTMNPVQAGSSLSSRTAAAMSSKLASAGSSFLTEVMPTSWQSACLPATYFIDPGSSPTSSVLQPRLDALRLELVHSLGKVGLDFGRNLLTVDFCGHQRPPCSFGAFYRNDRLSLEQVRIIYRSLSRRRRAMGTQITRLTRLAAAGLSAVLLFATTACAATSPAETEPDNKTSVPAPTGPINGGLPQSMGLAGRRAGRR